PVAHATFISFFHLSHPHPHLHSFPTRRSSDLCASAATEPASPHVPWRSCNSRRNSSTVSPGFVEHDLLRADLDDTDRTVLSDVRDRKSTRLNSSHGSISYAVFCLKKKKNMHTS